MLYSIVKSQSISIDFEQLTCKETGIGAIVEGGLNENEVVCQSYKITTYLFPVLEGIMNLPV